MIKSWLIDEGQVSLLIVEIQTIQQSFLAAPGSLTLRLPPEEGRHPAAGIAEGKAILTDGILGRCGVDGPKLAKLSPDAR